MFARIASTPNLGEHLTMRAALAEAGIVSQEPAIVDLVSFAGAELGYYVHVLPERADEARAVLAPAGYADRVVDG